MKRFIIPAIAVATLLSSGCSKELESRVDNLEDRMTNVENAVSKANQTLSGLNDLIGALQENDYVTDVADVKDASGAVIGYKITFSKRGAITIYHGKDGATGQSAPEIGVKQDTDGVYYWTLGGNFILDGGKKLPVTGAQGEKGSSPELKIENGTWFVSYDNGASWTALGAATGDAGDSFFSNVSVTDEAVTFEFKDGTVVTIPRIITGFSFKLESTKLEAAPGGTVKIGYTVKGAGENDEIVFCATYVTPGWSVSFDQEASQVAITAPDPLTDATIVLQAVDNTTGATSAQALVYEKGVLSVQDAAFTVGKEGGDINVIVSTNMDYKVSVDQEWISETTTKALREETLTFTVQPNTGAARTANITLTGTDGSVVTVTVAQETGEALPAIQVKPLFGFQPTVENPHGMTKDAHRTMAVVGDYLILSNAYDVNKMPVYNRFTGEYLGNDIVNTDGISVNEDQKFWAIASDDAGHLVALTFVDSRAAGTAVTTNQTVRGYVWKNGIAEKPASTWWAGFYNYGVGASQAFSNLKIAGDVTKDAVIASSAPAAGAAVFEYFTDGALKGRLKKSLYEGSTWWSGNVVPINGNAKSESELSYISVSGNFRQYISFNGQAPFELGSSYWYMGGGTYQRLAMGGDYIEAFGKQLFGVLNGWYATGQDEYGNNKMYYQLVVSNIGSNPGTSSLTDGLIFASRSSSNGTTAEKSLEGMGYGAQGMISPHAYSGTLLGQNAIAANQNQIGDVVFATSGANKVQVYGFAMNIGLIAYEITFN